MIHTVEPLIYLLFIACVLSTVILYCVYIEGGED